MGFKALASTSAGFAWAIGKADNRVTLDDVCEHLTALCAAVDLPVNADFEGGFAHEAGEGRGQCRARASRPAWPACRSRIPPAMRPSRSTSARFAIERIKAARAAIDADKSGVLLTGRCEGFLVGPGRSRHGDRPA